MEKRDRQLYDRYIEKGNYDRETNREKFMQKYMRIGKGEADALGYSNRSSEPAVNNQKTLEKQYAEFLNHQYQNQNKEFRKQQEDRLDPKQSKIH